MPARRRKRRPQESIDRDQKALALRAQGASFNEIGRALGFSGAYAYECVKRALRDRQQLNGEELIGEAEERLRLLMLKTQQELLARHYVVSQGKVMVDPETGQPLRDTGAVANLVQLVLRIEESRRKLLGIDRPIRHEVKSVDATYAELVALAEQMPQVATDGPVALPPGGTDDHGLRFGGSPSPAESQVRPPAGKNDHGPYPPFSVPGYVVDEQETTDDSERPAAPHPLGDMGHRAAEDVPPAARPDTG